MLLSIADAIIMYYEENMEIPQRYIPIIEAISKLEEKNSLHCVFIDIPTVYLPSLDERTVKYLSGNLL